MDIAAQDLFGTMCFTASHSSWNKNMQQLESRSLEVLAKWRRTSKNW